MISDNDLSFTAPWETVETSGFVAHWTGFLFVRGYQAGRDSVSHLLDLLRRGTVAQTLALAKGSFAIRMRDKNTRDSVYAVDPFGLMRLFVCGNIVSDDLFRLLRQLGHCDDELDLAGLASFLRFGFYNLGRTIDRRVRSLAGDEILHISGDGETRIEGKTFPASLARPIGFDFEHYIDDVARAMHGQHVSFDLTGGFDSRLLTACLGDKIPAPECATSGPDTNQDVAMARQVARKLALPHFTTPHRIENLEERMLTMLRLTNGQIGLLAYDRIYQLLRARQARGKTLCISGVGGEFWKDILWLQDFPFLLGKPDFEKLYRMRLEPRPFDTALFQSVFAACFDRAGQDYLDAMRERFGDLGRTAAYDGVYAFLRIPFSVGPVVTAGIRSGIPTFCPLLDMEGVAASANKPKFERLFSRWHRRTIRQYAPQLARLRTTDGLSSRTGVSLLADLPSYLGNKAARLAQKIAQRLGLPDVVRAGLNDPRSEQAAKALPAARGSMAALVKAGILKHDAQPASAAQTMYDRLLTSGLTLLEVSNRTD